MSFKPLLDSVGFTPIKARYSTINLTWYCTSYTFVIMEWPRSECALVVRDVVTISIPLGGSARSYLEGWRQVSDTSRLWRAKSPNQCGYYILVVIAIEPSFCTHRCKRLRASPRNMLIWAVRRLCQRFT